MKIKKGDLVVVLTGKDRGAEGVVIEARPRDNKVLVEGVNVAKRHQKSRSATIPAGIVQKVMPIDASNVAVLSKGKPTRVGYRIEADGKKIRIAKATGEVLP